MINVIGLGYIGLPTALMLAKSDKTVIGTDLNDSLIQKLNNGEITFKENGLEELFQEAIEKGIKFSTKYQTTDIYIIAVPTPYSAKTKKLDASFIISALESILKVYKKGAIVIIESTISPGTIDKYIRPELAKRKIKIGEDIHLAHAPERIIPGNMIYELINNSRTIGADSVDIALKVKDLYSSFCKNDIIITDIRSAEMSKVVENTFRDINIAFANELAKICRSDNMDVYEIIRIANKHPRVNILQPGPGVGGHCISVDPWFLVGDYPDLTNLILSARKVNDSMPEHVLKRIKDIMDQYQIFDVSRVGLYGLTYKENVDDIRESPTLQLLHKMEEHLSFGIKIYDPFIDNKIVKNQFLDFNDFIANIDLIVIMVGHQHIKNNLDKIKNIHVLDTKNITDFEKAFKL
jgi:UDP-N-acetyl-D-mannosaminuronic acid dehydrogenase